MTGPRSYSKRSSMHLKATDTCTHATLSDMKFSTRNAFYLRASNYRIVPLFLYLDERHVDWMSERVLQLVIADLKDKCVSERLLRHLSS